MPDKILSIICPIKDYTFSINKLIKSLNNIIIKKNIEIIFILSGENYDINSKLLKNDLYKIDDLDYRIYKENSPGIYGAMNQGLVSSKTEWVTFIGSDDWYSTAGMVSICNLLNKTKSDIVFFGVSINGKIKKGINLNKHILNLDKIGTSHSVGMFIRNETHRNIGFYDENFRVSADYDFYLRAIKSKYIISYENTKSGFWSSNGFSSKQNVFRKLIEHFKIRRKNNVPIIICLVSFIYCFILYYISYSKWKILRIKLL